MYLHRSLLPRMWPVQFHNQLYNQCKFYNIIIIITIIDHNEFVSDYVLSEGVHGTSGGGTYPARSPMSSSTTGHSSSSHHR